MIRDLLVSLGALRFGDFVLSSGARSDYYVDVKRATSDPRFLRAVAERIAPIASTYDAVAGMELGAVPIATAVALLSGKHLLIVRKKPKDHGTSSRIEGQAAWGSSVLVVEDVTTTGQSVLDAVRELRKVGYRVDRCVTVVDRDSGARESLEKEGVLLEPLLQARDLQAEGGRA